MKKKMPNTLQELKNQGITDSMHNFSRRRRHGTSEIRSRATMKEKSIDQQSSIITTHLFKELTRQIHDLTQTVVKQNKVINEIKHNMDHPVSKSAAGVPKEPKSGNTLMLPGVGPKNKKASKTIKLDHKLSHLSNKSGKPGTVEED